MYRILILLFSLLFSISALAAKPSGLDEPDARPELYTLQNPVEQAQGLLKELGFYEGAVDGIAGSDLENAIKAYEKLHGLKQSGKVSRDLLTHLENIGRVRALLKRLEKVREQRQEEARQALFSDPRTRKLLEEGPEEVADPTRDTSGCFRSPSSRCLLKEAVESSRAIFEDDLRDWALGEILAAQVRVGMDGEAMETASRIKDSRLVIAALTNIAKTQAREGKLSEALSGVGLIPVVERQLSVLLEIAAIYQMQEEPEKLGSLLSRIQAGAQSVQGLEDRLSIEIRAAVLMASLDIRKALALLDQISVIAKTEAKNGSRVTILRQTASAMAKIDHPEWALKELEKIPDTDARVPILMAASRAFLKMKRFEAARNTLQRITPDRYRAVILSDLAEALWQAREKDQAEEVWQEAYALAKGIALPFAKNFALSKIAGVKTLMAIDSRSTQQANTAYTVLQSISDDRLRARGLWDLAFASERYGFTITMANIDKTVEKALDDIQSKFSRAWILGDIADEHQAAGDLKRARKAFQMGLESAQELKNPWARSRALAKFGAVIYRLD